MNSAYSRTHYENLGMALPALLSNRSFVDVTLATEGGFIHCHRLILAACSPYFSNVLKEYSAFRDHHPIIILPKDVKFRTLQTLVEFVYKGEVSVTGEALQDFLATGEMLQICGLTATKTYTDLKVENDPKQNALKDICNAINDCEIPEIDQVFRNSSFGAVDSGPLMFTQTQYNADPIPSSSKYQSANIFGGKINASISCSITNTTHKQNEALDDCYSKLRRVKEEPSIKKRKITKRKKYNFYEDSESDNEDHQKMLLQMLKFPYDSPEPPPNLILPQRGPSRSYDEKTLWRALIAIRRGLIVRTASETYNINSRTLRDYLMKFKNELDLAVIG